MREPGDTKGYMTIIFLCLHQLVANVKFAGSNTRGPAIGGGGGGVEISNS